MKGLIYAFSIAIILCSILIWYSISYPEPFRLQHLAPVSVTTSSTLVIPAPESPQQAYKFVLLINNSNTEIFCNFAGSPAVLNQGIPITPAGNIFFDQSVPSQAVYCIHGGSGSKTVLPTVGY